MPKLNKTQHEEFALAYSKCFNAARAAELAKSKAKNLRQAGYEYLTKPDIRERIEELVHERRLAMQVDADNYDRAVGAVAFTDPIEVISFDNEGLTIRDIGDIPAQARLAISEVRIDRDGAKSVKFHSRPQALSEVARRLGIYKLPFSPEVGLWTGTVLHIGDQKHGTPKKAKGKKVVKRRQTGKRRHAKAKKRSRAKGR